MPRLSWLHLTDLHFGLGGQRPLWPNVKAAFLKDLMVLHEKTGPWNLVLFTGDLVQRGSKEEYLGLEEEVLAPLWDELKELGSEPQLLAVPGNHDLVRPNAKAPTPALRLLLTSSSYAEVSEELLTAAASEYRVVVEAAFLNYCQWWNNTRFRAPRLQSGLLPGDFSVHLDIDGIQLGIVGLNTAFLQLAEGDYRERLEWDVRQLHAACTGDPDGDGPAWVRKRDMCLLLTHHGPEWLSRNSRDNQYPEINPAGRFAVHLFGHMHDSVLRSSSEGGGEVKRLWQGNSMFGLEFFGDPPQVDRRHGYSVGQISVERGVATLRHWPRIAFRDANGWRFERDTRSCVLEELDGGTHPEFVKCATTKTPAARAEKSFSGLETYLAVAQSINGDLQVPGLKRTVPIEDVWVEPRFISSEGDVSLRKVLIDRRPGVAVPEGGSRCTVIIEARAGAGKSTLARFLATVIARDALGIACPDGSKSWQRKYLQVEPGQGSEVPLLINLRDVDPNAGLDGLLECASPSLEADDVAGVQSLLLKRTVAFIFDGLDEVSDDRQKRVIELLLRARQRWEKCHFVVTSRPQDFSFLSSKGFSHVKLRGLSESEGAVVLRRWATALFGSEVDRETFLEKARAAMARYPDIRFAASTPLAAAFMCWNYLASQTLPSSKASLYRGVVDWLLSSRTRARGSGDVIELTRHVLEVMAYVLVRGTSGHGSSPGGDVKQLAIAIGQITALSANTVEKTVQSELATGSCLEGRKDRVSFWHVNLRDYFAACWLLRGFAAKQFALTTELQGVIESGAARECFEMFVGLLAIDQPLKVDALLAEIAEMTHASLSDKIQNAALRSRTLEIATAHGYRPEARYREALRDELKAVILLTRSQLSEMGRQERIAAFSKLGGLQLDPRLQGPPTRRALALSAGERRKLGQYPVTVQEYSRFIRYGGYSGSSDHELRFLDIFKQFAWTAPLGWEEQVLVPNAPVVGVSWHEATAYCWWLQQELGGLARVSLPDTAEWSIAAGGVAANTGRKKGRTQLTEAMASSIPVGMFPEHQGPNGHDDLCALIWEWLGPACHDEKGRRRVQVTSALIDGKFYPVTRRARGFRRTPVVGFRIVMTPAE